MFYILLVTASTWPLDALSTIDTEENTLIIEQGASVPTLRESITDSLSAEMLQRERKATPSIRFRDAPPREPLERDVERYLLSPAQ